MNSFIKLYKLLNVLSLDVAVGAVIGSCFLSRVLNVYPTNYEFFSLGLTVWVIYTMDHLLDAKSISELVTYRHKFHRRYFLTLVISVIVVLMIIIFLMYNIPHRTFVNGLILGAFVVIYFFIQQKIFFLKEMLGAILYFVGIIIPSISLKGIAEIDSFQVIVLIYFIITVFINLILFSWFDRENDQISNQRSLVLLLGESPSKVLIWTLFSIQVVIGCCSVLTKVNGYTITLMVMNLALFIIFIKWKHFALNDRYRLLGDAIFLFPVIYLLG